MAGDGRRPGAKDSKELSPEHKAVIDALAEDYGVEKLAESEKTVIDILLSEEEALNPTDIAELTKKTKVITSEGIKGICPRLVTEGVLDLVEKCSRNHSRPSPHYKISRDLKSLKILIHRYLLTLRIYSPMSWQLEALQFMSSRFMKSMVNYDLVRSVLSSKQVFYKIKVPGMEVVHEGVPRPVYLELPVRGPGVEVSDMVPRVKVPDNLTEEQRLALEGKIVEYYHDKEEDESLLPLLLLVQISPSSLEYLLSDWKPDSGPYIYMGYGFAWPTIEHVVFHLIWRAVGDLAVTRRDLEHELIWNIYVAGGNQRELDPMPLLEVRLKSNTAIQYSAGFGTKPMPHKDNPVIRTNPENCVVDIKMCECIVSQ